MKKCSNAVEIGLSIKEAWTSKNNVGIYTDSFLVLLDMYSKLLFSVREEGMYFQKQATSIGSAAAPVLNNLYLAKLNGYFQKWAKDEVLAIFKYFAEYLVFHRINENEGQLLIPEEIISLSKELAGGLQFTWELAKDQSIRFIDTRLFFYDGTYLLGL